MRHRYTKLMIWPDSIYIITENQGDDAAKILFFEKNFALEESVFLYPTQRLQRKELDEEWKDHMVFQIKRVREIF